MSFILFFFFLFFFFFFSFDGHFIQRSGSILTVLVEGYYFEIILKRCISLTGDVA